MSDRGWTIVLVFFALGSLVNGVWMLADPPAGT